MFKNQFSIIVYNRIILYLCTSTPKYCIYYFVYPNQWSLGDIFAKYSRMLLILALLPWQLSGPGYFHMHDRGKRLRVIAAWFARCVFWSCIFRIS
jgi:hypothetical protein